MRKPPSGCIYTRVLYYIYIYIYVCVPVYIWFLFIYIYLYFFEVMYAYFQSLSPPFVSTLLIMYTHESITGHCGLSYRHSAAFIQRFFGNNFPRRTRDIIYYIRDAVYTVHSISPRCYNSNKYSPSGNVRFRRTATIQNGYINSYGIILYLSTKLPFTVLRSFLLVYTYNVLYVHCST